MKGDKKQPLNKYHDLIVAILVSNGFSVLLFLLRTIEGQSSRYWFLLWNLVLAWTPLLFAWFLSQRLKKFRWREPWNMLLAALWLLFLPNSFYIMSDLIHLHQTAEVSLLYDAVMFMSFILNGLIPGFASLYLIHRILLERIRRRYAHAGVAGVMVLSGLAVHLGRNLRWNSWDVISNPIALVFDVSEQATNPAAQSPAIVTTLIFSMLIGSIYIMLWQFMKVVSAGKRR